MSIKYWIIAVEESLDSHMVSVTREQIEGIARDIEASHEMYGEYSGNIYIPNPILEENKKLKIELEKEKRKIVCKDCNGTGRIIIQGPYHGSNSECSTCRGSGWSNP